MSEPLRFKPVNPAHDMVFSADGGWVAYEDYARLKAEVDELKAEVETLQNRCDFLEGRGHA